MAANAKEIHSKAAEFVAGRISLRQFEEWFVPATWDIHKANDSEAESLADEIDLNISEYTDGVLSADQLKQELAAAIRPFERLFPNIVVIGQLSSLIQNYAPETGNNNTVVFPMSPGAENQWTSGRNTMPYRRFAVA